MIAYEAPTFISSYWGSSSNGKKGAWCALTNTQGEWIQVDLRSTHQVAGVMTQGRSDAREWVTAFGVHYSLDGLTWTSALNAVEAGSEVFEGNTDSSTIETNDFAVPITARFIRFLPTQWQAHICMRFELVGKVVAGAYPINLWATAHDNCDNRSVCVYPSQCREL
ncbi:lactadherin-like [Diadema setosum]|uniref:lactadherin-like n=1 Tax=Diadema setosum TaxID=31175 RepID=UPI003B3ADF54